jgi:hypothetical protein
MALTRRVRQIAQARLRVVCVTNIPVAVAPRRRTAPTIAQASLAELLPRLRPLKARGRASASKVLLRGSASTGGTFSIAFTRCELCRVSWHAAKREYEPGLGPVVSPTAGSSSKHGRARALGYRPHFTAEAVRDQMIQQWSQEKRDDLWNEISGDIREPAPVDVNRIGIGGNSDVRASYRPHGVGRIGGAPLGGDRDAAASIIADGRARLDSDRAAAQAARTNRGHAAVDLQSSVSEDHNRGSSTIQTYENRAPHTAK